MDWRNVKKLVVGEPYDAEVEYLESNGTQIISVPNPYPDAMPIDLQVTGGANQLIFSAGGTRGYSKFVTDANGNYAVEGNLSGVDSFNIPGTTRVTALVTNPKSNGYITDVEINEVSKRATRGRGVTSNNMSFLGNANFGYGSMRIYGIGHYKLVRVGQVGCLYDPETGDFIYPSTGTLACGPDTRVINRQEVVKITSSDYPLVTGAKRVEYLQGDSVHNWIDTGITQSAGLDVELTIAHTPTSGVYFGTTSYTVEDPDLPFNYWYYVIPYGTGTRLAVRITLSSTTNRYYNSSVPWTIETPHTIKFVPSAKTVYVDGSAVITNTGTVTGYTGTQTYYLMQRFSLGTLTNTTEATCRLYGCKMWQDGTLVRDFVPIKVGTEGCLYDKVTATVYHNPGTVPFVCGPEVAETVLWKKPVPYDSEVEYLESNGTQYIETGLYLQSGDTVSMRASISTASLSCFWSARQIPYPRNTFTLFYLGLNSPPQGRFDYGINSSSSDTGVNTPFDFSGWFGIHEYKAVANKLYIDDVLYVTGRTEQFTTAGTARILASESASTLGTIVNYFYGKVYGFKVVRDGKVVMDLHPVRVGTTGYLFDRVSWTLFGNAGTGSFGYGADVPSS